MDSAYIVLQQVFIIFLLLAVGAVCYKTKLISESAADSMAGFALKVVTPCVVISAFQIEYDPKMIYNMLIAAVLTAIVHIIGIVLAHVIFGKKDSTSNVLRFSVIYSNCGFMGIPLISGVVGPKGVLYASVYVVVFQAIMWSHGVTTIKGDAKSIKLYKIFVNAGTIGIAIGLPLFFFSVKLPFVVGETVRHIANLNTPLAMIISGVFIARSNILSAFKCPKNYLCVFLRHIAVPLLFIPVLLLFKADADVSTSILILSACPIASAGTLFASQYSNEEGLLSASQALTMSNIFSVVTIPLVIFIYNFITKII